MLDDAMRMRLFRHELIKERIDDDADGQRVDGRCLEGYGGLDGHRLSLASVGFVSCNSATIFLCEFGKLPSPCLLSVLCPGAASLSSGNNSENSGDISDIFAT